jgi:hypothetical protein
LATSGDGECKVTWTSANPRPGTSSTPPTYRNGRVQILATAIGEESFDDVNSTGYYQSGDPFSNLGEPYLDANESGAYVKGDPFDNYFNTGSYVGPSGSFIGITCTSTSCSEATLGIGVEHLIIMSTTGAQAYLSTSSPTSFVSLSGGVSIAAGTTGGFYLLVTDQNGNPMAAGTQISATATTSAGTVTVGGTGSSVLTGCNSTGGPTTSYYTIPTGSGSTKVGGDVTSVSLAAAATAGNGSITIQVLSPESKAISTFGISVVVH